MKTTLKEKEQLQRISAYKLSELKRTIKHNSLKPIKKEEKPSPLVKGNEGKAINEASLELQRAITGKAFDRKPTLVKKLTEKGEVLHDSVEGSFYGDGEGEGERDGEGEGEGERNNVTNSVRADGDGEDGNEI